MPEHVIRPVALFFAVPTTSPTASHNRPLCGFEAQDHRIATSRRLVGGGPVCDTVKQLMHSTFLRGSLFMGRKLCSSTGIRLVLASSLPAMACSFLPSNSVVPHTLRDHRPWSLPMRQMTTQSNKIEDEVLSKTKYHDVLPLEKGSHNSAKLIIPEMPDDNDHFAKDTFPKRLDSTIDACRELGKSSLWVYCPMGRASLIEDMVDTGLAFHHAAKNVVVLNLWLRPNTESKIPEFATHNGMSFVCTGKVLRYPMNVYQQNLPSHQLFFFLSLCVELCIP